MDRLAESFQDDSIAVEVPGLAASDRPLHIRELHIR